MIIISAESSCDLSAEYIHEHNVKILMHRIATFKGDFYDGIEITGRNVIDYKKQKGEYPVSKCPKVEDYQKEFCSEFEAENSIIHITPAIHAYRSYGNASYAAKNIENVYIVDSGQVSYGYGLVVMEACRLRDEGYDVKTILEKLEEYKIKIHTYMIIQDFDCINNIDKSVAKVMNVLKFLSIYPYFCMYNDKYNFKGLIFGGQMRLYRGFLKRILKKTKNVRERVVITSEYDRRNKNELNKTLTKLGGEEFKDVTVKWISCSGICRYGENMLGVVEIVD